MARWRQFFILTSLALIAASTVADEQPRVGVFLYDRADAFIHEIALAADTEAKALGIGLNFFDGTRDSGLQIEQMQQYLAGGNIAALIVNPVDERNSRAAVDLTAKFGIPLIFFNRSPNPRMYAGRNDVWYVGVNPRQAGIYQAELFISYLAYHPECDKDRDERLAIMLVQGEGGHQDTEARTDAFLKAMKLTGHEVEVILADHCNWKRDKARWFINLHKRKLPEVEAIVCNNDDMALGVLDALSELGYNRKEQRNRYIPVMGVDGIPEAIEAVVDGRMIGTVLQSPVLYGRSIVRLAGQLIAGELDDEKVGIPFNDNYVAVVPYELVNAENARDFVKKP